MSLILRNITKTYRTGNVETTALDGVDLELSSGEFLAVMGPSGCGKSTLLNIAGLIDRPNSGVVELEGETLNLQSASKRNETRRDRVGFIFQGFNLIDSLNVLDNVALPLKFQGIGKAERSDRAMAALESIGIAHRYSHNPSQLSGGQQQRVAIARALVSNPAFILADEPTGNLDDATGRDVMEALSALRDKGASILMVTHSNTDSQFADRVVRMENGRMVA